MCQNPIVTEFCPAAKGHKEDTTVANRDDFVSRSRSRRWQKSAPKDQVTTERIREVFVGKKETFNQKCIRTEQLLVQQ